MTLLSLQKNALEENGPATSDKANDASIAGITDVLATEKVAHHILMFDEVAMEKRTRWDDKTSFLGICR